jgi:hypothetical protein
MKNYPQGPFIPPVDQTDPNDPCGLRECDCESCRLYRQKRDQDERTRTAT